MTEILVNKVLILLFVLSILNIIRNIWLIIDSYKKTIKFKLNNKSLILLGISISYFFTIIFSGFLK